MFSRLHIDTTPMRSRPFTLLLLSRTITRFGSIVTSTTILLHVARLTDSPLATGSVAAVQLLPILVLGLYGGHLADRFDRRRLAVLSEAALTLVAIILCGTSMLQQPSMTVLYVLVAASSALASVQRAALDSVVPRVVERDQLASASALLAASTTIAGLAAPAIAAALFFQLGPTFNYGLDAVSFALSALCLFGLPQLPPPKQEDPMPVHRSLAEGIAYVHTRPDLRASYLFDLAAMAFAAPTTMLPFLANSMGIGAGSGILFTAGAAGSLLMLLMSGWTSRLVHIGIPLAIVCALYGLTTALLGASSSFAIAVLLLAAGGAADALSVIFRDTLWNSTIPDRLRGRVAGVETVSYAIGAPLSGLIFGTLGTLYGFRAALVIGGSLAIASVCLIALLTPSLRTVSVKLDHTESEMS
mgnify:CR=1 FL=1|jgi:integral membrane protein